MTGAPPIYCRILGHICSPGKLKSIVWNSGTARHKYTIMSYIRGEPGGLHPHPLDPSLYKQWYDYWNTAYLQGFANDGIIKFTGKTPLHQVLRSAVLRETRAPVMRWKFNDQHHTINYIRVSVCVCGPCGPALQWVTERRKCFWLYG